MNNEDIKVLEEYLDKQDRKFVSEYRLALLQAIANLIAGYKELEEKNKEQQEYIKELESKDYQERLDD